MAFLASFKDTRIQLAAQIIAAALAVADIVFNIISFSTFVFTTNDMGALLGLGFHMFVKSIGLLIALSLSKNEVGSFNFDFLNKFAAVMMAIMIFDINDRFIMTEWEENEDGALVPSENPLTLNNLLGGYPMMFVSFFSSIIGLTTSLAIFGGGARSEGGTKYIKTIIIVHTVISVLLSSICFYTFFLKSGFFHVFHDLSIYGGQN